MKTIELKCPCCEKPFLHSVKLFNHAQRRGQKQIFCSLKCFKENKAVKNCECKQCGKSFLPERKEQTFCSINCFGASKIKLTETGDYKWPANQKDYIRKRKLRPFVMENGNKTFTGLKCRVCESSFSSANPAMKTCSHECLHLALVAAGRKAAQTNTKRSKNEILFYEKVKELFPNATHNEPFFDGWDADIIIHELKLAILWNVKWHYEKIKEKHSLLQVQTRDAIKQSKIESFGYQTLIIKDMGKHSKDFVEEQFALFKTSLLST